MKNKYSNWFLALAAIVLFSPWTAWTKSTPKKSQVPHDKFGVTQLHATLANGREWFSQWDNGHARSLKSQVDPDDPEFDVNHGDAVFTIDGKGVCLASGRTPRMYVYDHQEKKMWSNVEITVYGMRVEETKSVGYAGLMAYAKTNHTKDENICDDRGYGGRVTYDGRADIEKEIAHHMSNGGYLQAAEVHPWTNNGPMPKGVWIGYKFIARDLDHGTRVKLEIWRDMTDGKDGGKWALLTEYTDQGGWGVKAPSCDGKTDPAAILTGAHLSVYIRTDEVKDMRYKKFSVREIAPLP
jgi:hypothetical protein